MLKRWESDLDELGKDKAKAEQGNITWVPPPVLKARIDQFSQKSYRETKLCLKPLLKYLKLDLDYFDSVDAELYREGKAPQAAHQQTGVEECKVFFCNMILLAMDKTQDKAARFRHADEEYMRLAIGN